jgi:hypothetical protein
MQRITRLVSGAVFGAALLASAPSLHAAEITCTETANYVCCESSTGKVTCFAKEQAQ